MVESGMVESGMKRLQITLGLSVLLVAGSCTSSAVSTPDDDDVASIGQRVNIPGDWRPPPATLARALAQRVEVVEPPRVLPLGSCTSTNPWVGTCTHPACTRAHPGTAEFGEYIYRRWPMMGRGGSYVCRRNSNNTEFLSVHAVGRAIDVMVPMIGGRANNTLGDSLANWLIENAEHIGIQRVIWDGSFWNGRGRFGTASGHRDHIHLELSVAGANRLTPFFRVGPPPETCPVVCYGTAAVQADCSYTNCADSGLVCLEGPVRCAPGAPPEPPAATLNPSAERPGVSTRASLGRFSFAGPTRLFDTRSAGLSASLIRSDGVMSGPLTEARYGTFSAWSDLPTGTDAVWLNVTGVAGDTANAGFLTAHPEGPVPPTSTLNYRPSSARANATIVPLGTGSGVRVTVSSEVNVIADLAGGFSPTGLGLRPAGPLRMLDTRSLGRRLRADEPFEVDVAAPADARGIIASVAAIPGEAAGFLTAFPCGGPVPPTSNINFSAGTVTANTVIAPIDRGRFCIVSSHEIDAVVDVVGYLVDAGELSYQPLAPARLLDTRQATSRYVGRLAGAQIVDIPIQELAGMPGDVSAVAVNLTALAADERGFMTAFPCGDVLPSTSSLNYIPEGPVAAMAVVPLGRGSICVYTSGRSHLIVDLLGAWVPTPDAAPPTLGPPPVDPDEPDDFGPPDELDDGGVPDEDGGSEGDAGPGAGDAGGADVDLEAGCGCASSEPRGSLFMLLLGAVWVARRARS